MVKYLINKFIRDTILKKNIRAVISDLSDKYDVIVYVAAKEKEKT